jgi:histidinol-phosphate aminotransferase
MAALWEQNIRKVVPYVAGEQPTDTSIIKLNTNENPYGPSPKVQELADHMDSDVLKKYPDQTAGDLVRAIADYHGFKPEEVFVGVGSDDVLAMCFMTFFNSDKPVLFPDITYSFYPVWAEMLRINYKTLPLDENFCIRPEDYKEPNGGVIFPNPNAPTAVLMGRDKVEEIISSNKDSIVIVDEAYIDFAEEGSSVIDLTRKYDNLIVVRTFSKSRSLAGLRIGYAVANEKLIKFINDVKYSYNSYTMNTPSIVLGTASIEDDEYFKEKVEAIKKTREWFTEELKKLGFRVLPSSANFVFASPRTKTAEEVFEEAKKRGIYVRFWNKPIIKDFLRITIGLDEEMKKVVDFLKEFC